MDAKYLMYTKDVGAAVDRSDLTQAEKIARVAARRVAWAVAGWWRDTQQACADVPLPADLQEVLEREAPD